MANWYEILGNTPGPQVGGATWWAWVDGWDHVDLVELILLGAHPAPQLTTGAGRPCPALAWWGEPEPPVPPCTCRYGLFYVAGAIPTHALDPYANGWRRGVYAFRINRWCPHHGDAALVYPIGEPVDPRFWETLDDLERGNR